MKVTLKQLVGSSGALKALSEQNLHAALAFTLGLVVQRANEHYVLYDKQRENLQKKHVRVIGERPKDEKLLADWLQRVRVANEELSVEQEELEATEVELVGIGRIKASRLTEANANVTPLTFSTLDWLLIPDLQAAWDEETK